MPIVMMVQSNANETTVAITHSELSRVVPLLVVRSGREARIRIKIQNKKTNRPMVVSSTNTKMAVANESL